MGSFSFRQRDWQGKHFFFLSLAVMTASIIFLFAGRHLYNTLKQSEASESFISRLMSGGGFLVQAVNVSETDFGQAAPEPIRQQLKSQLNGFVGANLMSLELADQVEGVLKTPWVRAFSVKRKWPSELRVQIEWERPHFAVFSGEGWVLANQDAKFIANSKALFGLWAELPQIFGLELYLKRDIYSMNRSLKREQRWLRSVLKLLNQLESRLGGEVLRVDIEEDAWRNEAVFRVRWKPSLGTVPIDLRFSESESFDGFESLQYILSDLRAQGQYPKEVSAALKGRWIVQIDEEGGGSWPKASQP
ncbi:MAG: FtsQ-type POTRA domain-containing protein [Bradymonadales bacterium]|nr:MAG: FtsQ-type POTRA domain-containing protein [Bradymonadales bacterium]